ncbi:MAG: efflux RND transporter periplasmic adaptor subunit [Thermoanaerobaculia bacterium]|nr:efflux RND transporter periplasmic adaptor subunit [Thermoanaerobaculia bacterium]
MSESTKKRLSLASLLILVAAVIAVFAFDWTPDTEAAQQDQQAKSEKADDSSEDQDVEGEDEAEGEDAEAEEETAVPVAVTDLQIGRVSSYLTATANLVPESEVEVLAEWEGRLAALKVDEGDAIKKGQILAELARDDAEITLQKARVRADTARIAFERAEKLKQQELLAPDEFDKVEQSFRLAEQEVAEAEWRLEKTYIRAPFRGIVTQRNVQPGQHVRPGDSLFRVADFEPLVARIYLPEKDVLALETGRGVRLSLRADSEISFQGKIQKISPVVDTATGTVKVTVAATRVPSAVRPGAFVRVDIAKETRESVVLVPREAVVRELQSTFVFVAQGDEAEKREVTLGLEEDGRVEAVSGLAAGDRVITAGQGGLEDGAKIKLVESVTS